MRLSQDTKQIHANIAADRLRRCFAWICWAVIVLGLVLPMVYTAWRECGALVACIIAALLLLLVDHVRPHGKSYAAQCREVDAHYPKE